jgi:hypothetical protein
MAAFLSDEDLQKCADRQIWYDASEPAERRRAGTLNAKSIAVVHVARQIAGAATRVTFIKTSRLGHIGKLAAFSLRVTHPNNPRTIPPRRFPARGRGVQDSGLLARNASHERNRTGNNGK